MLINAGVRYGGGPHRRLGLATMAYGDRGVWLQPGMMRNWYSHDGASQVQGLPPGYRPPGSWLMAPKNGGVSSVGVLGYGSATALLAGGVNGQATLSGLGDVVADGSWIEYVQAVATLAGIGALAAEGTSILYALAQATLSGSGEMTADISSIVQLFAEADISGTGELTAQGFAAAFRTAAMEGVGSLSADGFRALYGSATLSGTSNLIGNLRALGEAVATLQGTGSASALPRADGFMSATIQFQQEALNPQTVARAVWDSVADEFTNLSTMGGQSRLMYLLSHHKTVTDPVLGTFTIFDADGTTPLFTAQLWEDSSATTEYRGQGADRRDEFA